MSLFPLSAHLDVGSQPYYQFYQGSIKNQVERSLFNNKIRRSDTCSKKTLFFHGETKERVNRLLKTYGLIEFKDKYPDSLSGGMRQRVALIRTLATDPDLLLLDEPFSALDYQTRLALSDDVYHIIKKEGKTAIMVTHDLGEAISLSDRIIVMTRRPAKVKKIYDIKLTNASTPINNRKCKEFSIYYDQIWRDLDVHL